VSGTLTADTLTTGTNTVSLNGPVSITNNTATALNVSGLTTVSGLTVTNALNVSGLTTVSGLTVNNALNVSGLTTVSGLTVNNALTAKEGISIPTGKVLTVSGSSEYAGYFIIPAKTYTSSSFTDVFSLSGQQSGLYKCELVGGGWGGTVFFSYRSSSGGVFLIRGNDIVYGLFNSSGHNLQFKFTFLPSGSPISQAMVGLAMRLGTGPLDADQNHTWA